MANIQIGTKFMNRDKNQKECTVIDIYKTYNNAGDLVKTNYVATHDFCGQIVTVYDIPAATICRGINI